jgi:hypothetical protein
MSNIPSEYSISPEGEKFPLPLADDYDKELKRLKEIAAQEKSKGREIVVVMGLGFVGAVMAAVVADSEGPDRGSPQNSSSACSAPLPEVSGRFPSLTKASHRLKQKTRKWSR